MKNKLFLIIGTALYLINPNAYSAVDEHGHDHAKDYEAMVKEIKSFEASTDYKPEILSTSKVDDIITGDTSAPVKIVEYASLSCGACKNFALNIMPELKEKFIDTKKAYLVYRHFALNNSALKAAALVNCAQPENKKKFIEELFINQNNWAFGQYDFEIKNKLKEVSKAFLTPEKLESCYNDEALQNNIVMDMKQAADGLLIKSTPSIYINGKRFTGAGKDALVEYINNIK